jgi:uncharacterized protein YbjT (DUF2867 family)
VNTLVLGANGKTGRRVADRLTARGVPVRRGTRPAFDWTDPGTWPSLLDGMAAVYVSYFPDLAVPGAVDAVRELTGLATRAGVRRLVLLSGRGEEEAQAAEEVVRSGSIEWTVVRCAWFAQNFSESFLLEPVLSGEVALPAGEIPEPFVDVEDIADVAFAALTEAGHAGEIYELTGPRALRFDEAVAEIAIAARRPVRFVRVSEFDGPPELSELMGFLFGELFDGRNAATADGVQRALGRAPRDFGEYARTTAAAGLWS